MAKSKNRATSAARAPVATTRASALPGGEHNNPVVQRHRSQASLSAQEVLMLGLRNGMTDEAIQARIDTVFPPV